MIVGDFSSCIFGVDRFVLEGQLECMILWHVREHRWRLSTEKWIWSTTQALWISISTTTRSRRLTTCKGRGSARISGCLAWKGTSSKRCGWFKPRILADVVKWYQSVFFSCFQIPTHVFRTILSRNFNVHSLYFGSETWACDCQRTPDLQVRLRFLQTDFIW